MLNEMTPMCNTVSAECCCCVVGFCCSLTRPMHSYVNEVRYDDDALSLSCSVIDFLNYCVFFIEIAHWLIGTVCCRDRELEMLVCSL